MEGDRSRGRASQVHRGISESDDPFAQLCDEFGISRQNGYKWVRRYEQGGPAALADRSRRPLTNARAIPPRVVELVVAMRKKRPRRGPRKLLAVLRRDYPEIDSGNGKAASAHNEGATECLRDLRRRHKDRHGARNRAPRSPRRRYHPITAPSARGAPPVRRCHDPRAATAPRHPCPDLRRPHELLRSLARWHGAWITIRHALDRARTRARRMR